MPEYDKSKPSREQANIQFLLRLARSSFASEQLLLQTLLLALYLQRFFLRVWETLQVMAQHFSSRFLQKLPPLTSKFKWKSKQECRSLPVSNPISVLTLVFPSNLESIKAKQSLNHVCDAMSKSSTIVDTTSTFTISQSSSTFLIIYRNYVNTWAVASIHVNASTSFTCQFGVKQR